MSNNGIDFVWLIVDNSRESKMVLDEITRMKIEHISLPNRGFYDKSPAVDVEYLSGKGGHFEGFSEIEGYFLKHLEEELLK